MQWSLVFAALVLGFASTPHCAAMCGGPCAMVCGASRRDAVVFQLGRAAGYMAAGAIAAGSVAALGLWSQAAPVIRPVWTLLHVAFLALGLWWLATGSSLPWLRRNESVPIHVVRGKGKPLRAGVAGLAWVAWPCGTLQAALMLSALASSPPGGGVVMAAFALASMPGLVLGPWMWARWQAAGGTAVNQARAMSWGYRIAGLGLAAASGWALTHGLWERLAAWCAS